MHIVLFEDQMTGENRPVTLPRPAFAVGLAATRLYDVAKASASGVSAIVRKYLAGRAESEFQLEPIPPGPALFVNASLVPSFDLVARVTKIAERGRSFLIQNGTRVAAAYFEKAPGGAGDQDESTITAFLVGQQRPNMHEELPLISMPHEVVKYHVEFFKENMRHLVKGLSETRPEVFVGGDVKIHPTAVLDSSPGPIVLEDGVTVGPFAYFVGPAVVGRHAKIIERASIKEEVQIGHHCKIGGEVERASIEPYTNKQHHGFLGHSYVGSWVNMGAGTSNSDLKNTYGEVTIQHRGAKVSTGMQFLGCIIGDYSKTAINTSIFTGKIIGISSYLYGFVGTNVPSFTNYAKTFGQETEFVLEAALKAQARMYARRNVRQTERDIELMTDLYRMTRDERALSQDQLSF